MALKQETDAWAETTRWGQYVSNASESGQTRRKESGAWAETTRWRQSQQRVKVRPNEAEKKATGRE